MSSSIELPARPKILFLRQDRIGDVFVSTPVVHAVRQRYPLAQVDFLLSRNNAAASFALNDDVDNILVLRKNSVQMLRLLWKLRRTRYDLVIDLNHTASSTSRLLIRFVGARNSIALQTDRESPATHVVPQGDRRTRHITDVLCDLTEPLGLAIPIEERRPRINLRESVVDAVQKKLAHDSDQKILGVQISGSSADRMYPIDAMHDVIRLLEQRFPEVRIIVLAAPSDKLYATQVASGTSAQVFNAGTGYESFAASIALCDWLLSPDTAAIHVAAAFDIPSVVLFSRDHRGYLNWLPYGSFCLPIITDSASLSAIPPEVVVENVAAMISR